MKVFVAITSLLTFVIISRILGENFLVIFAYLQSLIVINSALYDRGNNVTNVNSSIEGFYFLHKKPVMMQNILAISFVSFFYIFIFSSNPVSMSMHLLLSTVLTTPFSIYVMRWNTVLRRQGNLVTQIFFGELMPAIIRLVLVILSLWFDITAFIYLIALAPIFSYFVCSKSFSVKKLQLFRNIQEEDQSLDNYVFSVFSAFKNQVFGLVIPFLPIYLQSTFVVISRVYGITLIGVSGVFSRIPSAIFKYRKSKTSNNVIYLYMCIVFLLILLLSTSLYWLPIAGNVFGVYIDHSYSSLLLFFLVFFSIFISLNSLVLQVIGKVKIALLLEIIYFILFFLGINYVQ